MSKVSYANTVECLMYLMDCTRSDVNANGVINRNMANQRKQHWNMTIYCTKEI